MKHLKMQETPHSNKETDDSMYSTQWNGNFKTLWEMVSGGTQERRNHAVGQWEERAKSSLWHQLQNGLQKIPLETCIVKRGTT